MTSYKHAKIAIVFTKTDLFSEKKNLSCFSVTTNTTGYTVARLKNKIDQSSAETAQVILDNVTINSFGKLIIHYKVVHLTLTQVETQIKAARTLIYHAATLRDNRTLCLKQSATCKLFVSEMEKHVCRYVLVTILYEGTNEIQKLIILKYL